MLCFNPFRSSEQSQQPIRGNLSELSSNYLRVQPEESKQWVRFGFWARGFVSKWNETHTAQLPQNIARKSEMKPDRASIQPICFSVEDSKVTKNKSSWVTWSHKLWVSAPMMAFLRGLTGKATTSAFLSIVHCQPRWTFRRKGLGKAPWPQPAVLRDASEGQGGGSHCSRNRQ